MKNDFQLLDLAGLARHYQQTYLELKNEEVSQGEAIAKAAWDRKFNSVLQKLTAASGEAGSDGLEEEAMEIVGDYKPGSISIDETGLKTNARNIVVKEFLERNNISQKHSWFGIQVLAYFGSWTPVKVGDKYCCEATFHRNVTENKDLFALGAILLSKTARGDFFKDAPKGNQQYKSSINPLVPLVLGGQKKYNSIKYMDWDLSKVSMLENDDISKLVGITVPELSIVERLELRNRALTTKTGPRAGKTGNPETTAGLFHIAESSIGHLPKLARYMVLQTWAAHPSNRDKYAILDPVDWDNVPAELIGSDMFVPTKREITLVNKSTMTSDLPWEV
jgi:hypothetical protein